MSNKVLSLFILEGPTDIKFIHRLEQAFLGERNAIKCAFEGELYQLYRQIKDAGVYSLDIVNLLKERNSRNAKLLKGYTRDSFAYTYLFFDYDAHSTCADDDKLREMLEFFNNDTENGMLYISYPMVEAIRHYHDFESFRDLTVKCKRARTKDIDKNKCPSVNSCTDIDACVNELHYKTLVAKDSDKRLSNMNNFNLSTWKELINAHLCKANYLINNSYTLPNNLISQSDIFNKQLDKYIKQYCPHVAVLSAFPLFVLDCFGCEFISRKLVDRV